MFHQPILAADAAPGFGLRASSPRLTLAVDLGTDLFSRRWWQGLGTLAGLCTTAALLAPGLEPLAGGRAGPALDTLEAEQAAAIGITPLATGSDTGLPMTETAAVVPLAEAPQRTSVSSFATLAPGEGIGRMLQRVGASASDALAAERLVRAGGGSVAPGTSVAVTLGAPLGGGGRLLERLSLRARLDLKLEVARADGALVLTRIAIPVDSRPLRIRGKVGSGLYWSLRSAGASPQAAAAYLQALATRIEVGSEVTAEDRFTLVVAHRRAATGESLPGPLLYAGLDRWAGADLQLLRWRIGSSEQWIDAAAAEAPRVSSGLAWPVSGRITSGFGPRVHPILRFARMHRGVDFGAGWGAPIVAVADGQVVKSGWAGGYGRQVRIVHGGGLMTSYSHMSRLTVDEGSAVRRGQLIGYVGSSGLSTGPHLHFETWRNGVAVNPMTVRFNQVAAVDPAQQAAIRARLKELLGGP